MGSVPLLNGAVDLGRLTVGDGVANDRVAFVNAINLADSLGRPLWSPSGRTYLIDQPLILPASLECDLHGSAIKKTGGAWGTTGYAVQADNDGITLRNFVVDGNRAGGQTGRGIRIRGKVRTFDVESSHNTAEGFRCDSGAGVWDAFGQTTAQDNTSVDSGQGLAPPVDFGYGIYITSNGVARIRDAYCYGNSQFGLFVDTLAGGGQEIMSARCISNGARGVSIRSAKPGYIGYLHCDDSYTFGLELTSGTHNWVYDNVVVENGGQNTNGLWTTHSSATGVQVLDAFQNKFGRIVARANGGYHVSLYRAGPTTFVNDGTMLPARYNTFDSIVGDHLGLADRDPCLSILGGSHDNQFGIVQALGSTFAFSTGEPPTYSPVTNVNNQIDELWGFMCDYGLWRCEQGQYNIVHNAVSRGCFNTDATWPGLVTFLGSDSNNNRVKRLYHTAGPSNLTGGLTKPTYLAYADASAVNNRIHVVEDPQGWRNSAGTPTVDNNGANVFGFGTNEPARLSATSTWDPASIADGAQTSGIFTVTGARVGDPVSVGFSTVVLAGMLMTAAVTANDVVTVTLFNKSGVTCDLASGTLTIDAWRH